MKYQTIFLILDVGTFSFASSSEIHCSDPVKSQIMVSWSIGFLVNKYHHFSEKLFPHPFLIQLIAVQKVKHSDVKLMPQN